MKQSENTNNIIPAKRTNRKNQARLQSLFRALIQLFFFLTMPGAFAAGFSGIRYIFEQIGSQKVIAWNSFLLTLIFLCLFTILFGRFFCGFICAFGSLGDLMYAVSGLIQRKIFRRKKQLRLPETAQRVLQKAKYLILAILVVLCSFRLYSTVSGWDPWTVFSMYTALRFNTAQFTGGLVLLVLILIGMAFQERFFCQFLCPMGAVFSLLPILPFSYLKRDPESCIKGCSACKKKCPVQIKLEQDGFLNGECIGCEKCRTVCPKGNLTRWDLKVLKKGWISILIRSALFFVIGCSIGLCRFF